MKRIICTVTNDLSYDQRMQRICSTLANAGFRVTLAGRRLKDSKPLTNQPFHQQRLTCFFNKGFAFYAEYNLRLFFWLLFRKADIICAIDLDTIVPCYLVSALRRKKRVYDAHELFTEQKEVMTRPFVHAFWLMIEKICVPGFKYGYTVSQPIAAEFKKRYNVDYAVIRNLPVKTDMPAVNASTGILMYQGAVNEARGLENLVIAMHLVDATLHIYGDGNICNKITGLIKQHSLDNKIVLKGKLLPDQLRQITPEAAIGINLVEPIGLNQYYSLANKFFDYVQAGVPQLTMNFPAYKQLNEQFEVAVLANDTSVEEIASKLNLLLQDQQLYNRLKSNCKQARLVWHWQPEGTALLEFYNAIT